MKLVFHDDAAAELREMFSTHPHAAASIATRLQEIQRSPQLWNALAAAENLRGVPETRLKVYGFNHMVTQGYDVWILKVFDGHKWLLPFRVHCAYSDFGPRLYILAFMNRAINYEQEPEFVKIIKHRYTGLGVTVRVTH
jgi:hypothetical protein